jgi:hypothetical protein
MVIWEYVAFLQELFSWNFLVINLQPQHNHLQIVISKLNFSIIHFLQFPIHQTTKSPHQRFLHSTFLDVFPPGQIVKTFF